MAIAQMLQSMELLAPMYTGLKHLKSKLIFHNPKFTAGFYILSYNKRRFTIATQIQHFQKFTFFTYLTFTFSPIFSIHPRLSIDLYSIPLGIELLSSTGKLRIYSKMSIRNYQRLLSFKDIPDSSLYLFLSFFLLEVLEQFESGKVPSKKPPKIMFKSFVKMTLKKLVELRLVLTNITGLYLQNLKHYLQVSIH